MGLFDPSGGQYLSPAQAMGAAMMAASGPSRLPVPIGSVIGQGVLSGQNAYQQGLLRNAQAKLYSQEAQKNELGNAVTIARMKDIASRHPDWFQGVTLPGSSSPQPSGLLSGGTPAAPSGGLLGGQPDPGGYGQFAREIGHPELAPSTSATSSAPSSSPAPSVPQFKTMQDAQDYLFLHPEMKDIIAKQYPGPTDAQRSLTAAGIDPASPQGQMILRGAAVKDSGMPLVIGGQRPGVPAMRLNPVTGQYEQAFSVPTAIPGATTNIAPNGQPYFTPTPGAAPILDQNAARGPNIANRLDFGNLGMAGSQPGPSAPSPASPMSPSVPALSKGPGTTDPVQTPSGTTIPPVTQQAPMQRGSVYLKERLPQFAKTENAWAESLPSNLIAEQRGLAIADALKKTESGAWATEKANVAASLKAVGIDLPQSVLGDPAQVQRALKDNFAQTLATIKSFSSRPAAAEVILGQKNYSNPNLQPEANLSIISETVGQMRWERAMMHDWAQAKQYGWVNPQDFQRAWTQANPLQKFIDQTKAEIGPLKGMPNSEVPKELPTGSKQIGTYGGKPVYQLPDGSRKVAQ